MMNLTKIEDKSDFARFIDRVERWNNFTFDDVTKKEMEVTLSRSFTKEDFNYCEKNLIEDDQKKFRLSPADLYKICLKSKKEREKRDRLKKEIENSNNLTFNKAGRTEVEKAINDLKSALKNRKKEDEENKESIKINLYDYVDLHSGRLSKVLAKGDFNESLFKKACKNRFYSKPHTVKKIYHLTVTKEQLDKSGNPISKYSTLQSVSSMCEGASLYTVGLFN